MEPHQMESTKMISPKQAALLFLFPDKKLTHIDIFKLTQGYLACHPWAGIRACVLQKYMNVILTLQAPSLLTFSLWLLLKIKGGKNLQTAEFDSYHKTA